MGDGLAPLTTSLDGIAPGRKLGGRHAHVLGADVHPHGASGGEGIGTPTRQLAHGGVHAHHVGALRANDAPGELRRRAQERLAAARAGRESAAHIPVVLRHVLEDHVDAATVPSSPTPTSVTLLSTALPGGVPPGLDTAFFALTTLNALADDLLGLGDATMT